MVTNFSHGHHGDATDADNPRVRWRYDPAMAGVSGQFADCGIHALHMASFICDDEVEKLSADFASTIPSRVLEDDAMVNFRMSKGTVGRLWTSSVAIGRQHGFDIQVFGETGGFRWASEQPNQLIYTPVGGRTQIMEKGEGGLYDDAKRLSRVAIAHPEGFPLAVANIYCDLADAIRGTARDGLPTAAAACGRWRRCMRRWPRPSRRRNLGGRASADVPLDVSRNVRRSITRQGNRRISGGRSGVSIVATTRSMAASMICGDRLADRRQPDVLPARHFHVVQPDQPDIVGHRQAGLLDRAQRADGQQVIAAEVGLGRGTGQQALHFGPAGVKGVGARHKLTLTSISACAASAARNPAARSWVEVAASGPPRNATRRYPRCDQGLGRHPAAGDVVDADHMHVGRRPNSARRHAPPAARRS